VAVPSPWSAPVRSGTSVLLSQDRTFDMSTPFGNQFTVAGQNLLAGPITLYLQTRSSGVNGTLQAVTATPVFVSNDGEDVVYSWSWSGVNGAGASGTITIGYDGAIRQQFTITRASSVYWNKIQLSIPLAPGVCDYLMRYPRIGYGSASQDLSTAWSFTHQQGGTQSAEFPRVIKVHDGEVGLEWAMESDVNWSSYNGGNNGTITVDPVTGIWNLNVTNGQWPFSAGTQPLSFDFWFTPLPCRPEPADQFIRIGGETDDNPECIDIRLMTEECPDSVWERQGSCKPRVGTFGNKGAGGTAETFAQFTARLIAKGMETGVYSSPQIWPTGDSGYSAGYFLQTGWTDSFYTTNCDGLNNYTFPKVDCRIPACADMMVARWTAAITPGSPDYVAKHLYFDVTNLVRSDSTTVTAPDTVGRFTYIIKGLRDVMKRAYALTQSTGALLFQHSQSDWVACCHNFSDVHCPGEQWAVPMSQLSTHALQMRYFLDTVTQREWRTEIPVKLMGQATAFLPTAIGWTAGPAGQQEDLNTEVCLAAICQQGLGYWKSFGTVAPAARYMRALKAFGTSGATFRGYWQASNPLLTEDGNALVATLRKGNQILVFVTNLTDSDRNITVTSRIHTTTPVWRYHGQGISYYDSRSAPGYLGNGAAVGNVVTGVVTSPSANTYTVGVARKNMTMFEVTASGQPQRFFLNRRMRA
jgi:hypothetical protein